MIQFKTTLVSALQDVGIPVMEERELSLSKNSIPCITYALANDIANKECEVIRYSEQIYLIKYWCDGTSYTQVSNCQKIDNIMFALGFKRIEYNELTYGDKVAYILRYQGLGKEFIGGQ